MAIRHLQWLLLSALLIGGCSTTNSVPPKNIPAPDASVYAQAPTSPKVPSVEAHPGKQAQVLQQSRTPRLPIFDPESTIYFQPQSTALTSDAMQVLRRLADRLRANRLMSVVLIGHTDDAGGSEYCLARATKLTGAVSEALENLDVRPTQIRERPKGNVSSQYPGCTSDDCRRLLRRVELQISGS